MFAPPVQQPATITGSLCFSGNEQPPSPQHSLRSCDSCSSLHFRTHDSVALDRPTAFSGVFGLLSGFLTSSTTVTFSATTGALFGLEATGTATAFFCFSGWAVAFFVTTRRMSGVSSNGLRLTAFPFLRHHVRGTESGRLLTDNGEEGGNNGPGRGNVERGSVCQLPQRSFKFTP